MTEKQHKNLIMSAILPSTLAFLAACLGVVLVLSAGISLKSFMFSVCLISGIVGYFGLIRLHNNILKTKVVSNFTCLICGFVSYVLIFYLMNPISDNFLNDSISAEGFLFVICLIWIFLVYCYYIILLSKKLIQEKRNNRIIF